MGDSVFVVQEEPTGRWIAMCCDRRCEDLPGVCGEGAHTLAEADDKPTVFAAVVQHRKKLEALPRSSPDRSMEARRLLREVLSLFEITHKYGSQGGHDVLGEDLGCAGCALAGQIRQCLDA